MPFDTNSLPWEHVTKKGHLPHCKKVRLSLVWLTIAFSKCYYSFFCYKLKEN